MKMTRNEFGQIESTLIDDTHSTRHIPLDKTRKNGKLFIAHFKCEVVNSLVLSKLYVRKSISSQVTIKYRKVPINKANIPISHVHLIFFFFYKRAPLENRFIGIEAHGHTYIVKWWC